MTLQCATCSNVTVWTQVCTAPMTQFPHLAVKLADQGHKAREQLHTAVQQPPGTESVNTSLTYTLKCRVKVRYCCRVLTAEDYRHHSAVPLIAQNMILVSQAFVQRPFSVCSWLTVGRRNRMEKSLNM